ncbi:MAG: type II toxin-antitoxin system antitoxin, RelB/DinJ family [Magnetococcales bacterium]|nr:type II toxin-antitoxin system antitoxin, RelB/DinJ family [Magnetococcales bacterium]
MKLLEVNMVAMGRASTKEMRVQHEPIEQSMPFPVREPNSTTFAAMDEAAEIMRRQCHRFTSGDELLHDLENGIAR